MNAARIRQAMEIFDEVCDLVGDVRTGALTRLCGGDAELRAEVERMLRHDSQMLGPIAQSGAGVDLLAAEFVSEEPDVPEQIGRYRVIREIGRGGMGVVYEAEQESPRRRVALKVMRGSFAGSEMRRRFRREAQLLGHLQHRGIAHIYEAGSASMGSEMWPFIAMEYVEGVPLDEHAGPLSRSEKLELLARVSDAVQHAHQKGIVHRDLKPANVLVVQESSDLVNRSGTIVDSIGQPKILDFGIARLTDADLHATMQTHAGQIIGTLSYMSPEQLAGDAQALDTRCDVYALGLILYRLVTGRPPFDLAGLPIAQAARIITETDPPTPGSIDSSLRGDIDTIVLKAMSKHPALRYESAAALADDLRRCIRDEPISARPATALYQFRKFARRHKGLVAGVSAALVVLIGALVAVSVLLAGVARERDQASLAEKRQDRIAGFQASVLNSIDLVAMGDAIKSRLAADIHAWARQREDDSPLTVDQLLLLMEGVNATDLARASYETNLIDHAAEEIDRLYTDDPVVEATLRETVAQMYQGLFHFEKQLGQGERALALRREALGNLHPETLRIAERCAYAAQQLGRRDEAISYLREAIAGYSHNYGEVSEKAIEARIAIAGLLTQDRPDEAELILRTELDRLEKHPGLDPKLGRVGSILLAGVYAHTDRIVESVELYERAVAEQPTNAALAQNLAGMYSRMGRNADAMHMLRRAIDLSQRSSGNDHEVTIVNRLELASILKRENDLAGAVEELEAAYGSSLRGLAAGRTHRARAAHAWARELLHQRRFRECEAVLVEAITTRVDIAQVRDEQSAVLFDLLSNCLSEMGQTEQALAAAEKALSMRRSLP